MVIEPRIRICVFSDTEWFQTRKSSKVCSVLCYGTVFMVASFSVYPSWSSRDLCHTGRDWRTYENITYSMIYNAS